MKLRIFTTGGTIDKMYFDAKSDYQIGPPAVAEILAGCATAVEYEITELFRKDSLEMTEQDRALVRERVAAESLDRVLITHGTDTMADTGRALLNLPGKVIVLTGALSPARFKDSDAPFNVGLALGAVQCLTPGVYIAMNGKVFPADGVRKNRDLGRFEEA